jgi:hypothetical protein
LVSHLPPSDCYDNGVVASKILGQAGADVSVGFKGGLHTSWDPIMVPLKEAKGANGKNLCVVNVHWHTGAEHRSAGEYDETFADHGPGGQLPVGLRCKHYNANDPKFTKDYDWKHCLNMRVGETYEVHWPHSSLGDCGTKWQYQTPFPDGAFCHTNLEEFVTFTAQQIKDTVGVQGQVFTIVNDEAYYHPNLFDGMIVNGAMGQDITKYTGTDTGSSYSNTLCSNVVRERLIICFANYILANVYLYTSAVIIY